MKQDFYTTIAPTETWLGEEKSPEERLWSAVIAQCIKDCFGRSILYTGPSDIEDAQDLFLEQPSYLDTLCLNAAVDAQSLRAAMVPMISRWNTAGELPVVLENQRRAKKAA